MQDARDRIEVLEAQEKRWRLPKQIIKGVGIGGFGTALYFLVQTLISMGDTRAQSHRQTETVMRLEATVQQLLKEQAQDRAQAAADHSLLMYLSARLGGAPSPFPSPQPQGTP